MIRLTILALAVFAMLSACGRGGGGRSFEPAARGVSFASGPIARACLAEGRKAASTARCGCIQAVADRELSGADQRRGAGYFSNPARLQEVRQSDRASDERFWKAWKAYGAEAAKACKGT